MKNIFQNTKGKNTVQIDFNLVDGSLLSLWYSLNNNPVQHIWQDNIINNSTTDFQVDPIRHGHVSMWIQRLNGLLIQVAEPALVEPVTSNMLNELHSKFVNATTHNEVWQQINVLIHIIETKIDNPLTAYNATINFKSVSDSSETPIEEHYKLWLTTQTDNWGELLLGYDTKGKDYFDIWYNNDTSVLGSDQVATQQYIRSETSLIFEINSPYKKWSENHLYNWYVNQDSDIQKKIPLNNLNKLSLGRYLLGNIIITDNFLEFHPSASDWYVPNHQCRLNWNIEVMSKIVSIKQLIFFDSDLCFDTLVKHTKTVDMLTQNKIL